MFCEKLLGFFPWSWMWIVACVCFVVVFNCKTPSDCLIEIILLYSSMFIKQCYKAKYNYCREIRNYNRLWSIKMASYLSIYSKRSKDCALSQTSLLSPAFWVGGWVFWFFDWVFWLQAKASLCCNVNTGTFGEEVLNKNIYSGKRKKNKTRKQRQCPMCAP